MATFDFIASDQMRACLQRDAEELIACLRAGAWKSAHVIAGSLIQATLVDYLATSGDLGMEEAARLPFGELLDLCRAREVLSPRTVDLAGFLRPYDDYLSPSEPVRTAAAADETSARIAQALLEIVINEVSARRRARFHYTAEQAVAKVLSDPSSEAILGRLVTKISRPEIERLLLDLLPKAYFETLRQEDGNAGATLARLARCYRLAFDAAPDDVKRAAARRFVDVLENESEFVVQTYQSRFFRGGDLAYLDPDERALVLAHLFAVLQQRAPGALVAACEGIGPYLSSEEDARGFFVPLVAGLLGEEDRAAAEAIERRILEEAARLAEARRRSILDWLGRLRWSLERDGHPAGAARLEGLLTALTPPRGSPTRHPAGL